MDIDQLVESLAFRFSASGVDNARRVAEELLAHVFACRPLEIYTGGACQLGKDSEKLDLIKRLEPLAVRIENGEPLQYVVGHVDFWGLEIKCDPRALIPRPETELLVEEVLSSTVWNNSPATVVDVGTGTGCIVLTLAKQRPDANFKAVDLSPAALELARENARFHGLEKRILWMENDLLERFAPESADAVVANLPYIASDEWKALAPCVRDHEPQTALDSGPTGMELITGLSTQARYVLIPGGTLFLEFGFNQGKAVFQCLERLGYSDIQIKHDLAGHDRIAIATNP
jgi:release factor glutamine methyltransferase